MNRVAACLALLCIFPLKAIAEPIKAKSGPQIKLAAAPQVNMRQHSLYLELFGKSGMYGIGYDYRWKRRLGVGVVASSYKIGSERTLSLSPYLSFYPVLHGHHGLFTQAGPLFVNSPVPGSDKERTTSTGAQFSLGYEYKNRLVMRAFVMGVVDGSGVGPWAGASVGFAF